MTTPKPPTATAASIADAFTVRWGLTLEQEHDLLVRVSRLLTEERRYTREVLAWQAENHDSETAYKLRDSVLHHLSRVGRAWLAKCVKWERERRLHDAHQPAGEVTP